MLCIPEERKSPLLQIKTIWLVTFLTRVPSSKLTCIRNISCDKTHFFNTSYIQTYFLTTLLRIAFQPLNKRMNVSSKKLTNLNQSWNTGKSEMDVSTDLCSCSLIQKCYKQLWLIMVHWIWLMKQMWDSKLNNNIIRLVMFVWLFLVLQNKPTLQRGMAKLVKWIVKLMKN